MCSSPYISFFTKSKSLLSILINKDISKGVLFLIFRYNGME